ELDWLRETARCDVAADRGFGPANQGDYFGQPDESLQHYCPPLKIAEHRAPLRGVVSQEGSQSAVDNNYGEFLSVFPGPVAGREAFLMSANVVRRSPSSRRC